MYKLIFYKMTHNNPMFGFSTDFMVAIEDEKTVFTENSIFTMAREYPEVVNIQSPPEMPKELCLEAKTLTEAHYMCMQYGYKISSPQSTLGQYWGPHICGKLEEEYEKMLKAQKGVIGA